MTKGRDVKSKLGYYFRLIHIVANIAIAAAAMLTSDRRQQLR